MTVPERPGMGDVSCAFPRGSGKRELRLERGGLTEIGFPALLTHLERPGDASSCTSAGSVSWKGCGWGCRHRSEGDEVPSDRSGLCARLRTAKGEGFGPHPH